MRKAAICDDEAYMRKELFTHITEFLRTHNRQYEIDCYPNGQELLSSSETYDFIFLDIQMDGLTGLETASRLRERGFEGILIFVTVLRECVFDAFGVEALDYLLKPLNRIQLELVMERCLKKLEQSTQEKPSLVIQKQNECLVIPLETITFCEVIDRKVYVHTLSGKTLHYYHKLETLEPELNRCFFRCHRSYLVNLEHVLHYEGGTAHLAGGESIPVSRLRHREFLEALLQSMRRRAN